MGGWLQHLLLSTYTYYWVEGGGTSTFCIIKKSRRKRERKKEREKPVSDPLCSIIFSTGWLPIHIYPHAFLLWQVIILPHAYIPASDLLVRKLFTKEKPRKPVAICWTVYSPTLLLSIPLYNEACIPTTYMALYFIIHCCFLFFSVPHSSSLLVVFLHHACVALLCGRTYYLLTGQNSEPVRKEGTIIPNRQNQVKEEEERKGQELCSLRFSTLLARARLRSGSSSGMVFYLCAFAYQTLRRNFCTLLKKKSVVWRLRYAHTASRTKNRKKKNARALSTTCLPMRKAVAAAKYI